LCIVQLTFCSIFIFCFEHSHNFGTQLTKLCVFLLIKNWSHIYHFRGRYSL